MLPYGGREGNEGGINRFSPLHGAFGTHGARALPHPSLLTSGFSLWGVEGISPFTDFPTAQGGGISLCVAFLGVRERSGVQGAFALPWNPAILWGFCALQRRGQLCPPRVFPWLWGSAFAGSPSGAWTVLASPVIGPGQRPGAWTAFGFPGNPAFLWGLRRRQRHRQLGPSG